MLKYLYQTVRDLSALSILLSLIMSLSFLFNFKEGKKILNLSIIVGVVLSFVFASLKYNAIIRKYQYVILYVLLFTLIITCVNLFFLYFSSSAIGKWIYSISSALYSCLFMVYALPDVINYPHVFLTMDQSIISTEFLFKLTGYLLGILVIFLLGLSLYNINKNHSLLLNKILFTFSSMIYSVFLYGSLLKAMQGRKWIKIRGKAFHNLTVILNGQKVFIFILIAIALFSALLLLYKSFHNQDPYSNKAELRKIKARLRNQRRNVSLLVILCCFTFFDLTYISAKANYVVSLSPAEPYEMEGDKVVIPLERFTDGKLHRFEYKTDDIKIRFVIIQKNAFSLGVGFDACEICGATGYYEKNGQVICKLCEVVMNINTIGYKGGCNPIPLPYTVENGSVVINSSDLMVEKYRFR